MFKDPDVELMVRFQKGDEEAFQRLFNKHKRGIINFIYRFCQDRGVAEELAQEVFLRIYESAHQYRPTAKFSSWIFRIATNICLNELRKAEYQAKIRTSSPSGQSRWEGDSELEDRSRQSAHSLLETKERRERLRRAITKLPERQRIALILNIYYDFSYREIAEQIGCPEGTVKTLIHRSKEAIKQAIMPTLE